MPIYMAADVRLNFLVKSYWYFCAILNSSTVALREYNVSRFETFIEKPRTHGQQVKPKNTR